MIFSWFPASWTALHGAITHFPVALLLAGAAFDVAATVRKKAEWRLVSFWMLALAVAMAIPSLATGWIAGGKIYDSRSSLPPIFVWHRALAFITSGLALLLLMWRTKTRDYDLVAQSRGHNAMVALSIFTAIGVGITGHFGGEMVFGDDANGAAAIFPTAKKGEEKAVKKPTSSTESPQKTASPAPNFVSLDAKLVAQGKAVYKANNCSSCHQIANVGGKNGPNLTHIGSDETSVQWHIEHLKNPRSKKPNSSMPAYDYLSTAELKALSTYLVSLK